MTGRQLLTISRHRG